MHGQKFKEYIVILTKLEIIKQVHKGNISIEPFYLDLLNPNSYNYRLSNEIIEVDQTLDAKKKTNYTKIIIPKEGFVLQPNKLYLASTFEKIGSSKYVTQLIGRSSVGRLGMFLQVTAPLGHIGTFHNWTLEIKVVQPLRVYPLMKIGQVTFWKTMGRKEWRYSGDYKNYSCAHVSNFYRELK